MSVGAFVFLSMPRVCFAILFLLAVGGPSLSAQDATLTGEVDLGPAPRERRATQRYAEIDRAQMGEPSPRVAVVSATPLDRPAPRPDVLSPAVMWQRGLHFHPRTLPVLVGTTVEFPSADETYHSVFSYSKGNDFDLGRYLPEEEPPTYTFETPGEVRLFCDVHEHMRASILVLETPYFTVTDPDGRFTLAGLPPGRYRIDVWVNPRDKRAVEVNLAAEETRALDFPR